MATTPKRSLKRTLASTVEDRTPRFLLGSLALAMVISLLAGLGIGMKVEQHRVGSKKPKTSATAATKKKKKKAPVKRAALVPGPLEGKVVSARPTLLVVSRGKTRVRLLMVKGTAVELASPASASSIVPGAHVIFTLKHAAAGTTTSAATPTRVPAVATHIVVVGGTAPGRLGSVVTAATADSMTIKFGTQSIVISTVGARIDKTRAGTRADLVAGRSVAIRTYRPPAVKRKKKAKKPVVRSTYAVEIVVLPAGSTFS